MEDILASCSSRMEDFLEDGFGVLTMVSGGSSGSDLMGGR